MSAFATGGEPQKKIIPVSEDEMAVIQSLLDKGVGQRDLNDGAEIALRKAVRSSRASQYKQWRDAVDYIMTSRDKRCVAARKTALDAMRAKFLVPGSVHTDRMISDFSVMYANEAFIGEQLAPVVVVPNKSDVYPVFSREDIMSIPDDTLSSYGTPNMLNMSTGSDSYTCLWYGYTIPVSADTALNQDLPYDVLMEMTEIILSTEALKREIRIASLIGTATAYGTNTGSPTVTWDNAAGGDPIGDMHTMDEALWSGFAPSRKVMFSSLKVAHVLMRHPDILALFQYNGSSPGLATPSMIARFLDADEFLVGASRYNSSKEGQTASYSRVWADVFGLIRVANRPTLRSAGFASTFRWNMTGIPNASTNNGMLTQQWYDQTAGGAGVYYAKHTVCETHKCVAQDAGYLLTSVLT